MKVFLYSQKLKEKDIKHVHTLFDVLGEKGVEVLVDSDYHGQLVDKGVLYKEMESISHFSDALEKGVEMVITLGGDGTILNAIEVVQNSKIPIIGINLGRLGFLSSIEKSKIRESISNVLNGEYYTEERTLLKLGSNIPLFEDTPYALNDFTLHKRDTSSMITIHTYVDGNFLNSYWADGLVVSTATGSTGYALSCGGPIIFPSSKDIVITPVAPHNLNVRPIVISDFKKISFEIEGRSENFLCTLDSRYETITSEHQLFVERAPFYIKLAHPNDITFMKTIRSKLMWGLDRRNH